LIIQTEKLASELTRDFSSQCNQHVCCGCNDTEVGVPSIFTRFPSVHLLLLLFLCQGITSHPENNDKLLLAPSFSVTNPANDLGFEKNTLAESFSEENFYTFWSFSDLETHCCRKN
jgi:hypothetical protein